MLLGVVSAPPSSDRASQLRVAGGQEWLISLALFQMFCIAWIKVTEKSALGKGRNENELLLRKAEKGSVSPSSVKLL